MILWHLKNTIYLILKFLGLCFMVRGHGQPSNNTYQSRNLLKTFFVCFFMRNLTWLWFWLKASHMLGHVVYHNKISKTIGPIHKLENSLTYTRCKIFLTFSPCSIVPFYDTWNGTTIMHKIFETNSSLYMKQRTTKKVQFLFFGNFLPISTKFVFWEEE